ncbi:hypothetical protein RKD49_007856 [Streptomyces glaucescens]
MLTSLLPGLRELRTPLAIGYLYLLSLFLLVGNQIPTKAEAQHPLDLLYGIVGWTGKPAALAVGTFAAYLVGSVLEVHATTVNRTIRSFLEWGYRTAAREEPQEWGSSAETVEQTVEGLSRVTALQTELTGLTTNTLIRYAVEKLDDVDEVLPALAALVEDLPQLRTRLYREDKDLYGDYDRLTAAADFKVNVGFSTIVLSVVAAVLVEPLWSLLSVPMAFLFYRGLSTAKQANDVLVQAIVTDVVKSPSFDAYVPSSRPEERPAPPARSGRFAFIRRFLARYSAKAGERSTEDRKSR